MRVLNNATKHPYQAPWLVAIELNADIDCLRSSMDNFVDAPKAWAAFEEAAFEEQGNSTRKEKNIRRKKMSKFLKKQ